MKTLLVTGGAGFIGSNYILDRRTRSAAAIISIDALTYAGNVQNLASLAGDPFYNLAKADICDGPRVRRLLNDYAPDAIVHFAAESHVDRSIAHPDTFITTNIVGTFTLLEEAKAYWEHLDPTKRAAFRFHHISTDEVYGSLAFDAAPFTELSPYAPKSPYSASKAASDHLVRSYFNTYGLPVLITNCSNNYGPYQFPEKMIPLMILNALEGEPLPIYGDGKNVRDWLHVHDHVEALVRVLDHGVPGETYNIGGSCEKSNLEVVTAICDILDELLPDAPCAPHASLIHFVKDRPGHDRRYAIDASKLHRTFNWKPAVGFDQGIRQTIDWYMKNSAWVTSVKTGGYKEWVEEQYEYA